MKKNVLKIGAGILTAMIIAGAAYGAYYFLKKSPILDKLANLFAPGPLRGPTSDVRAKNLDAEKIIYWTNYYRAEEKIPSLFQDSKLTAAAKVKAEDLFDRQYFEHISPTGESAADLVIAEGYNYRIVGENLALGDFKDEKELVGAWMASPGHRENILKKDYQEIGVASILSEFEGRATWISVQIFGSKAPQCATPDQNLKSRIDNSKTQVNSLTNQINKLSKEAESLISQGNTKIKEGNRIYQETGDKTLAQPYWDEGERLQNLGQQKINQAKSLESQYNSLQKEFEKLIREYNDQVNKYNACIQ